MPPSASARMTPPPLPRFILCLLLAASLPAGGAFGAELRVGRGKVVITPPIGSVIGNSYGINVSTGVSSDVHAKAVVFELAGIKAALVSCDLISLHPPVVRRTRELIAARTGVPPERVILAATHCHAGPQTHPLFFALAGAEARQISEQYVEQLPGLIAESVRLAEADLQPARLFAGRGREDTISFNRRFLLRDGTVKMNPGRQNPAAIRPMGPIDPEVGVVYAESPAGAPLVTIVNFALHVAVVGGNRVSADYPHTLAQVLARVKGDSMLTVFINGMSGNINHTDVSRAKQLSGEPEAARIGAILAAAVLKTYPHLQPITPTTLAAVSRPVPVPVPPPPSAAEVGNARAIVRGHGKGAPFSQVIRAWRTIDLATYGREGFWPSEVQAITFGRELALIGYPGDSFVELGLAMKQNSPFEFTFVSEQSGNGSISYIPNEKAFPEGSYEVDSARIAPGGGEVLATAAIRLLTELFPRP
jgi:neutral ceramidase